MTRRRNFAPQAIRDVEQAADWLAVGPGGAALARRFLSVVVDAAALIARRPLLGHRRSNLLPDPFRFQSVTGFPYLLVYNASRPEPQILRILHMARDLGPLLADLPDLADPDAKSPC